MRAALLTVGVVLVGCSGGATTPRLASVGTAQLRFFMGSPNANAIGPGSPIAVGQQYDLCGQAPSSGIILIQIPVTVKIDGMPLGTPLVYGQVTPYEPITGGTHQLTVTCSSDLGGQATITNVTLPALVTGTFNTIVLAGDTPYQTISPISEQPGPPLVGASTLQIVSFVDQNPASFSEPSVTFYDAAPTRSGLLQVGFGAPSASAFKTLGSVTFNSANSPLSTLGALTVPVPAVTASPGIAFFAGIKGVPFPIPTADPTPYAPPTQPQEFPSPTSLESPSPSPTSAAVTPGTPALPSYADPNDIANALPFNRAEHISVFIVDSPATMSTTVGGSVGFVPLNFSLPPSLFGTFP